MTYIWGLLHLPILLVCMVLYLLCGLFSKFCGHWLAVQGAPPSVELPLRLLIMVGVVDRGFLDFLGLSN